MEGRRSDMAVRIAVIALIPFSLAAAITPMTIVVMGVNGDFEYVGVRDIPLIAYALAHPVNVAIMCLLAFARREKMWSRLKLVLLMTFQGLLALGSLVDSMSYAIFGPSGSGGITLVNIIMTVPYIALLIYMFFYLLQRRRQAGLALDNPGVPHSKREG